MKHYEAVIFDCDGVLVNSEEIIIAAELALLAEIGLEYEQDKYHDRFLGMTGKMHREGLDKDHMDLFGKPIPESFWDHLTEHLSGELQEKLQAIPGSADLIAQLPHVKAVASSSQMKYLTKKLHKTGLHDFFDPHIYAGDMVSHGKPEPDLFLLTAEKIGIVPENCLVIEDSQNGVIAARRAGMDVIGFSGGGHCGDGHDEKLRKAGAFAVANDMERIARLIVCE